MADKNVIKEYTNGTVTIVWKPGSCIHSTVCWKQATGLPSVFNPRERPWIRMEGARTEEIVAQVQQCPSGALSFYYNETGSPEAEVATETRIEVLPNGPLLVYGNIVIRDKEGAEDRKTKVTAFCRCGQSRSKPYCDGSHIGAGFEG